MVTHFRSLIAKLVVAIHTLTCRGEAEFQVFNYVEIDLDTRVYDANGVRLFNTNYFAELWGGKSPFELVPAVDKWTGLRNAPAPFTSRGFFRGQPGTVPSIGSSSWLQVRVWDTRLGATYEEVVGKGLGGCGESPLFLADGARISSIASPEPLRGLQSFRLRPSQAVLMRGVRWQDGQVVVEWHPGFPRYQLQHTATLEQPWQNLGEPTTATASTNAPTGDARFFRVVGLLD